MRIVIILDIRKVRKLILGLSIIVFLMACQQETQMQERSVGFSLQDSSISWGLGSQESVDLWEKYLGFHNDRQYDSIAKYNADAIHIEGSDGLVVDGSDNHIALLKAWIGQTDAKWTTQWVTSVKDVNGVGGEWVLSGHNLKQNFGDSVANEQDFAGVRVEDGKIIEFYVFSKQYPKSPEATAPAIQLPEEGTEEVAEEASTEE